VREPSNDKEDLVAPPVQSEPWGDSLEATQTAHGNLFRTYSHNPNGLSSRNDNLDMKQFAAALQAKEVAMASIYEVNRNFEVNSVLESFHSHLRGASTHYKGIVSSIKMGNTSDYQPGGTAVLVRNQWATRYLSSGSDILGRWSWITLTGKGTKKVSFISAYRVCEGAAIGSVTSGTVRSQQEWHYASNGQQAGNLRERFVTEISTLILDLQSQGHDIQLSMDANEASGPASGVDRIMSKCKLVDAHKLCESDSRPMPATYSRGSKKIDFVLISPSLVVAVVGVSILELHDGYISDHRALVVDYDATLFFGGPTSPIVAPQPRRLTSTNPKAVHTYTSHMRSQFEMHLITEKRIALVEKSDSGDWTTSDEDEFNRLDDTLKRGCLAAENKCDPRLSGLYAWSPELHIAGTTLEYWKLRLKESVSWVHLDSCRSSQARPLSSVLLSFHQPGTA
jgi:hypothetical protein